MNPNSIPTSNKIAAALVSLLACVLFALAGTGCGSLSGPGSASFASVVIDNHTGEEIANATVQVFRAEGYNGGGVVNRQIIFQKEASRMNTIAYQGLVAAHEGAMTLIRVKVDIVDLGPGSWRLQCQAYVVRDAGDSFFEDEQRLANFRGGEFQDLLIKVANKLKTPASTAPPTATGTAK